MNTLETYKSKLVGAEQAAALVPDNTRLLLPFGPNIPPAICAALAKRACAGGFTCLRVTYAYATQHLMSSLFQPDLLKVFHPSTPFPGPLGRRESCQGRNNGFEFLPIFFHQYPRAFAAMGFDSFALQVSPMDKHGYFSVGAGHDYSSEMIHRVPRVIVEVNRNMPRTFGDGFLHVSEVAAIVENDSEMLAFEHKPSSEVDRHIARHVVKLIPDRATVQIGLGSVPDAVCEQLENHCDLGIHSELISPALGKLMRSCAVTNKYKTLNPNKSVFTLMLADNASYDFVDDNPTVEGYSVAYVNDPTVLSQIDNLVSINGLLQVDLTGQVNSEMVDQRQFSAVGGQTDFMRGARASKGGKSILATRSTASNGKLSKIVPFIRDVVTDTRMDTQYVVTEYGVANLEGKSCRERALALIEIAHPDFRDGLLAEAKTLGIVP